MDFITAMHTYLRAERNLGWGLVALGLVAGVAVFFIWRTQAGGFRIALGVPLLLLAFGGLIGGAALARQSAERMQTLAAQHEAGENAVGAEVERMAKVNDNWKTLKASWTGLFGVGLALLLLGGRDWTQGLGLALLILATVAMTIDVFAERRAQVYTERITPTG